MSPNIAAGSQSSNCHLLDKKYHTFREPGDWVPCQLIRSGSPSTMEPFAVVGTRDRAGTAVGSNNRTNGSSHRLLYRAISQERTVLLIIIIRAFCYLLETIQEFIAADTDKII